MTTQQPATFADIARELHGQPDVDQTLDAVLSLVTQTIHPDYAGIMLVHRGRRVETAAVTDDLVAEADKLQFACGGGPCLDAMDAESTFVIHDTVAEVRWKPWCEAVSKLGIRGVLSVRLFTSTGTIGALNLYSRQPDRFDRDDAAVASVFAGHASVALAAAQTESGLREAIDGRHQIGLAQGILMERFDLTQDQAFAVLRRYSQDRNTKLRAVAAQVVQTRKLPE